MKVTALLVAGVFAIAATADYSTDANSRVGDAIKKDPSLLQRYCSQPGNPCHHVKKAAEKAGQHLTYPDIDNSSDWEECYKEGGKCQKAKRAAEALASAVADAHAAAEPEADPRRPIRFCHLVGQPCLKARDPAQLASLSRREAAPDADARRPIRFCHLVGQPCLKAREPEPMAQPEPRVIRFCHLVGQPCLKTKRSALPAPEPEANADPRRVIRFCHLVGQPCLKVRSATDEIGSALYRRAADPRRVIRFCHLVGQPCLKARDVTEDEGDNDSIDTENDLIGILDKRCNDNGAPCAKAKRAAEDLSFAALQALEQSGLDPSANIEFDD